MFRGAPSLIWHLWSLNWTAEMSSRERENYKRKLTFNFVLVLANSLLIVFFISWLPYSKHQNTFVIESTIKQREIAPRYNCFLRYLLGGFFTGPIHPGTPKEVFQPSIYSHCDIRGAISDGLFSQCTQRSFKKHINIYEKNI